MRGRSRLGTVRRTEAWWQSRPFFRTAAARGSLAGQENGPGVLEKDPRPDDSLTQLAAGSVDAPLLCILEQLPFGTAASLGAGEGHTRASRPIALAARGVHLSGLVAVEYVAVGVLL